MESSKNLSVKKYRPVFLIALKDFFFYMFVGAALFWIPDFLIHLLMHFFKKIIGFHVLLIFILCTIISVFGIRFLIKNYHGNRPLLIPSAVLIGIWCLGGPILIINTHLMGNSSFGVKDLLELIFFPPLLIFYSLYDGSATPLILVTFYLIVLIVLFFGKIESWGFHSI